MKTTANLEIRVCPGSNGEDGKPWQWYVQLWNADTKRGWVRDFGYGTFEHTCFEARILARILGLNITVVCAG